MVRADVCNCLKVQLLDTVFSLKLELLYKMVVTSYMLQTTHWDGQCGFNIKKKIARRP